MTLLKWLLAGMLVYAALLAIMAVMQRSLMYFPNPARIAPGSVGLAQAEEVQLQTEDGERVVVWHVPARGDKPVVIYFQGNGGGLDLRAHRFGKLVSDGTGLVALNYRGYGGSTGRPTEPGLLRDAAAAYRFAADRYPPERIVLWGESLGTGVAVATAAAHPVARVLLESPYSSTADVAASIYWFIPVRWLMHDQFRSDRRIPQVTAPVLIVHGENDRVIPIRFAERLFALATGPKSFVRLPGADHNDHEAYGVQQIWRPFIDGQMKF
jgi:fermentation-respiration switch protein FrsA (DUF1100 family)